MRTAGVIIALSTAGSLLATASDALDGLVSVRSALTMRGYVNAAPGFTEHAAVLDGASAVLVAAFGDAGRPARSL